MDRGAWRATVHEVTESDTIEQLNNNNLFKKVIFELAKNDEKELSFV